MSAVSVSIVNRKGLHARASASFVKLACTYDAVVKVEKDGVSVSGDSIMGLMMLAAAKGDTINLAAEGREASEALTALETLVSAGFHEED